MKRSIPGVVRAVVIFSMMAVTGCSQKKAAPAKQKYEFTSLTKNAIQSTVTSTGTLAVVSSVDVLAQMSGRIEKVFADYNDQVKKGQVLAKINTDLLRIQEKSAQASVDKSQAAYDLQVLTVQNNKALYDKGFLSEFDYKSSLATLRIDRAELASAEASLEEITTEIDQYAFITAPIDGIILSREIDAGSSVTGGSVSSSTTLFTIAANLEQMEIEAEVDELDISSIQKGQKVTFTVEADPGVDFTGTVKEVRLVPETSDNLVYYYVIILADNKSGKLLPGMTANLSFIKQEKEDAVTVPSAALRFTPSLSAAEKNRLLFAAGLPHDMSAADRTTALARYDEMQKAQSSGGKAGGTASRESGLASLMGGGMGAGGMPGGMGGGPGGPGGAPGGGGRHTAQKTEKTDAPAEPAAVVRKTLWYIDDDGKLAAALVQTGISDSLKTEIIDGDFLSGKKIILKIKVE
jgi:HlyD family secretion protein